MEKFKDPHCRESNPVFLDYNYNSGNKTVNIQVFLHVMRVS